MILVVGGGVAGAAASCDLAAGGRRVVLVERAPAPQHKVCGEFISIEAQERLLGLGVDLAGAAPVDRLRLCRGRRVAEAMLPFRGLSLSRRTLDERLLRRAEILGADVRRGIAARSIASAGVTLADGTALRGDAIVLATGKHDLRGAGRPAGTMIGFKLHYTPAPAGLGSTVEIHLFPGGYAGLEPIEGGAMNLCFVVERAAFAGWRRDWERVFALCPLLAERVAGATPASGKPLTVAAVPYGFLHRAGVPEAFYRIGDQAAVIPSFAGDGIAIALHTARRAAAAIVQGDEPGEYARRLAAELAPQMRRAAFFARALQWKAASVAAVRLFPQLAGLAAGLTRVGTGGPPPLLPRERRSGKEVHMSKSGMPPIPPEGRSGRGPGVTGTQHSDIESGQVEAQNRNVDKQGRQGNTKQNTTHQGHQQDR